MWQEISAVIAEEFSDLPDAGEATRVALRLLLAAMLGGILGFEREHKGKAAGVRTHMLVAMGAAVFVMVPSHLGAEEDALSRVVQGIVAGIGFLCAGTILKGDDLSQVKGLTTAAGLWLTAAIGIAAGMGREATAVLTTFLALVILFLVPGIVSWFERRVPHQGEPHKTPTQRSEDSE
jgi:putative Mg2+ transporter-C (MgtC) family protein